MFGAAARPSGHFPSLTQTTRMVHADFVAGPGSHRSAAISIFSKNPGYRHCHIESFINAAVSRIRTAELRPASCLVSRRKIGASPYSYMNQFAGRTYGSAAPKTARPKSHLEAPQQGAPAEVSQHKSQRTGIRRKAPQNKAPRHKPRHQDAPVREPRYKGQLKAPQRKARQKVSHQKIPGEEPRHKAQHKAPRSQPRVEPTPKPAKQEQWRIQKQALKKKFEDGWAPLKRLSPDAMDGVRELHRANPERFSTPVLAEHFKISPEAIRRILKSKWRPTEKESEKRNLRWERRKIQIWNHMAELGLRPHKKFATPSDSEQPKPARKNRDSTPSPSSAQA
ncbi:Required for respiratory growth protein 9 mitochondrial [Ophidiomyces ophidiicola]|nr:Required for respiratory growth protein 9 mitochondrial [Ophidiomyces ophidiicola]KAI1993782.1 Required for respiratory growth protein 9 mitochondrial [Ophidiomyces ophidiicola]KAI1997670.1 Required for respiratory growth protein 9 mitochondrial [Ophidiomyces ophidiicola]KAI1999562.1 Required for respiratory growth protein 9 mitochondrial [Ophidiomyces ophidiicola]